MLRFAVALLALTTYSLAASIDECSWGESYWCSSLENAKTCGAFEHCKSTVWKNQIQKVDDSEYCDFCKTVIQDVAKFLKDNRTEQDILRFMKNACQVIPNKGLAGECSELVDKFLVQIMEMVVNDINPKVVCALIKLCTGFEDTVVHAKLPETPVVEQTQPITIPSPLQINSEPICTDCKKFFTDIKNLILNNATEAELEALIDQALCAHLGTYEPTCVDLVKTYLPEIVLLLSTEFDPNVVCQSFGFCSATLEEAKTFLVKLKLKGSDFYKMASASNSNDGCSVCKTVMKDIQDLDRDAAVQRQIKNLLKTEICGRLGAYKDTCSSLIDQYSEFLFQLLANELDPESRCRSMGFCAANDAVRDITRESTPSKAPVAQQNLADSPQCVVCKFVVEKIDNMLKQNATKQQIIAALDKICGLMPEAMRDSCLSFVNEYGPYVIDLLAEELDPNLVCSTIGLCSSKPQAIPSKVPVAQQNVADTPQCMVCKLVVEKIDAMIKQNATKQEIIDSLDKICGLLPESLKDTCLSFVNEYGPYVIDLLVQELDPNLVCSTIGLCSSKPRTMPSKVFGATECVICESVVQYVEALLQENATLSQIEAVLEKVCNFLPDKFKSECDYVVHKFGPYIIQYISTAFTPKAICELVGACQTQMVRPNEMAALTEAKIVKSSHQLLGAIECSWGPKYWCASRENAKQCQATDYCDQTGWDL